ncbi:hypothetical protein KAI87_07295, partial [Myxococcota bacterium]|nr:hypothetical protein [Myxococcota bacterium]
MRYLIHLSFSMILLSGSVAFAAEEASSSVAPEEISAKEVGETENADISVIDSANSGGSGGLNLEKEAFAGLTLRETLGYGGLSSGAVLILGGYLALHFQKDTTAKYDADE